MNNRLCWYIDKTLISSTSHVPNIEKLLVTSNQRDNSSIEVQKFPAGPLKKWIPFSLTGTNWLIIFFLWDTQARKKKQRYPIESPSEPISLKLSQATTSDASMRHWNQKKQKPRSRVWSWNPPPSLNMFQKRNSLRYFEAFVLIASACVVARIPERWCDNCRQGTKLSTSWT